MALLRKFFTGLTLLICSNSVFAEFSKLNFSSGVMPISRDIYNLHMTVFGIFCVIGIIVFSILIYALIKHRKAAEYKTAKFNHNTKIEIIWAIIPLLIVVAMVIPATIVLHRMGDDSTSPINIKLGATHGSGTGHETQHHSKFGA
jgi:cytochrome c oxidase subunit II